MPVLKVCNRCGDLHPGDGPTCARCYRPRRRTYTRDQLDGHRIYRTAKWKRVRVLALDRDGYRCQSCHGVEDLVVHHHREVREGIDPFDLDNLETLCRACHGRLHGRRRAHAGTGGVRDQ